MRGHQKHDSYLSAGKFLEKLSPEARRARLLKFKNEIIKVRHTRHIAAKLTAKIGIGGHEFMLSRKFAFAEHFCSHDFLCMKYPVQDWWKYRNLRSHGMYMESSN